MTQLQRLMPEKIEYRIPTKEVTITTIALRSRVK